MQQSPLQFNRHQFSLDGLLTQRVFWKAISVCPLKYHYIYCARLSIVT